jgi:tRNA threonylcarbamoyladenosine biosynthesis protein TsaE
MVTNPTIKTFHLTVPNHTDHTDTWFDSQTRITTFDSVRSSDVDRLAALMLHHLPARIAVGLVGTLGAGKTRFVQAVAKAAQIDDADVTSPTFTLLQTYLGTTTLHHLDAYRIEEEDEFLQLGVDELFEDGRAWTLVEWADRVRSAMPMDTVWIRILIAPDPDLRVIQVACPNEILQRAIESVASDFDRQRDKSDPEQ